MIQPKDGREGRFSRTWAVVAGLGIVAVSGIETYALSQGVNGSALTASLAAIAALGGAGLGHCVRPGIVKRSGTPKRTPHGER